MRISAFLGVFTVAPLALACPGAMAAAHSGCACSGLASYVSALSVGVLVGLASVGVEGILRRRR